MDYKITIQRNDGAVILNSQSIDAGSVVVILSSLIPTSSTVGTGKGKMEKKAKKRAPHECCGSRGPRHLSSCINSPSNVAHESPNTDQ